MTKLTLQNLKVPLLHINQTTIFVARDYSRKFRKEKYDMEVWLPTYGRNLQRELCWTIENKAALIRSMLYGNFIAPISAVIAYRNDEDTTGYYQIIDGKQRLTAIFDFIEGAYPVTLNDASYYYKDFDYRLQQAMLKNAPIINLCIDEMSDDDKIAWYLRLNYAGVPQQTDYLKNLQSLLLKLTIQIDNETRN